MRLEHCIRKWLGLKGHRVRASGSATECILDQLDVWKCCFLGRL